MGSYKWGYKSLILWVITMVTLLITPLITTHEPSSELPKLWTWNSQCAGDAQKLAEAALAARHKVVSFGFLWVSSGIGTSLKP